MMNNQDSILLNDDGWVSVKVVKNRPPINQDILVWLTSEKPNRGDSVHGIATDRYFDDEYKGFRRYSNYSKIMLALCFLLVYNTHIKHKHRS